MELSVSDVLVESKQKAQANIQYAKNPLEKLRYQLLSRGAAGIKDFARIFRVNDDDGTKTLNRRELHRLVVQYGVKANADEVAELFEQLDTDGTGSISFDEFIAALRPPLSLKRLALINSAFEKLDKDGDGLISMKDMDRVYDYLQNSDFRNEDQAKVFDEFLNVFELFGHGDGKALCIEEALGLIDFLVSKEEFFNYCCGISASIDNDAQFERVMKDAWQ